jgi:hypothetical protein
MPDVDENAVAECSKASRRRVVFAAVAAGLEG